jgi:hypothetical protein
MLRTVIAVSALLCASAPAFADPCEAATEVASRAALDNAAAANRRTAIVRVQCAGERQTFVFQRVGGKNGSTVTVREVKAGELSGGSAASGLKNTASGTSTSRVIRVGD